MAELNVHIRLMDAIARFRHGFFSAGDVRNTACSVVLRGLGAIVSFLTSIVVMRILGQEDAGLFFLGIACVTPAALVSRLGADMAITKVVAKSQQAQVGQLYRVLLLSTTILCMLTVSMLSFSSDYVAMSLFGKPEFKPVLSWMAWAIVGHSVSAVIACVFQGMNRINHCLLFGGLLSSILFLVILFLSFMVASDIDVLSCAKAYVASAWLSAAVAVLSIEMHVGNNLTGNAIPTEKCWEVVALIPSLLGMVVLQQAMGWLPQLMLGVYRSSSEVASLAVAVRISNLIALVLVAVNSVLAPRFAKLFSDGRIDELRLLAQRFTRLMAIACMPLLLLEIIFPKLFLEAFGISSRAAMIMLSVLAVGQLVNVATGSVGLLLNMCGQQVAAFWCNLFSAGLLVCTSFLLIPVFGGIGAAIAQSLSASTCMVGLSAICRRTLGFAPIGGLKFSD